MISSVGSYSAAPPVADKPTLGITPFKIEANTPDSSQSLSDVAADQIGDLIQRSGRFSVINRQQTAEMLEHENLTGIVRPGRFIQSARIPGMDYLLLGTLSNLRITRTAPPPENGVMDKVKHFADKLTQNDQAMVSASATIALQIVQPSTGDVVVFNDSELQVNSTAAALGLDVMHEGTPTTQPRIGEPDRIAVTRLALDDALRKSLPKIDRFLESQSGAVASSTGASHAPSQTPTTAPTTVQPAQTTSANVKICPNCGAANDKSATFCTRCGAKL
jgi:ribosomal protein L40E